MYVIASVLARQSRGWIPACARMTLVNREWLLGHKTVNVLGELDFPSGAKKLEELCWGKSVDTKVTFYGFDLKMLDIVAN